jgi:5-bromo-4-chloroindolyl phosphate hydrolysis protein
MTFLSNRARRKELLLKEGKLDHEAKLIRDNLKEIREKKQEIENALKQVDGVSPRDSTEATTLDIDINHLLKYSESRGIGNQVMSFFIGFLATILMLSFLGL